MRRTAVFVVAAGAFLAGCGLMPSGNEGIDDIKTGSITPAATPSPAPPSDVHASAVGSLAQSDWEAIRAVAADRLASAADGAAIDWSNPETGNSGNIAALAAARARGGGLTCRPIALTVSDVRGVRGYHGNACRLQDGAWQLSDISADDKTLL